jgi:hypothetical protein
LFIGFVRSFLPAGRALGANILLAEPRAILGVDLTGHASGPTEVRFKSVGFERQIADLIIDGEEDAATDAGPLCTVLPHEGRRIVGHLNDPRKPVTWQDECLLVAHGLLSARIRSERAPLYLRDLRCVLIGDHLPAETIEVLRQNYRGELTQRVPGRWDYVSTNIPIRIVETSIAYQAQGHRLLYLFCRRFLQDPLGLLPLAPPDMALFRDLYRLLLRQRPVGHMPAPWGYEALRAACQAAMTALLRDLPAAGRDSFLSAEEASPDPATYPEAERDDGERGDHPIEFPRGAAAPN